MADITIRTLKTPAEMEAAVELQKIYWGEDMGALVPGHMLMSLAGHGGHIPAAFDGDRMVGMLVGFIGAKLDDDSDMRPVSDRLLVMSKRMVVLPEYRSHNIGTLLKLAQREFAIRYGIQLVTWTFDPLLARNAYLNLFKLGAIGQKYAINYFGADSDYAMLNEDRLVVNWWVLHPHTLAHVRAEAQKYDVPHYVSHGAVVLNPATFNIAGLPEPAEQTTDFSSDTALLEIPVDSPALEKRDTGLMRAWRNHVQILFTEAFAAGYLVTGFIRDNDRTFYVLTRDDGTYDFTRSLL